MTDAGTTLLVIAKEPVPGRVKTRLTAAYSPGQAAALARAALADTLRTGLLLPVRRRVLVLDGRPGDWLPPGYEVWPQVAGGLDERLAAAFAGAGGPALLIGMDTPQVSPELLAPATRPDAWERADAYFGPALDGGFWALGLAEPDPALLRGVPMSVPETGAEQLRRLREAGLRVGGLPPLRDVDNPPDVPLVAAEAPRDGAFAAEVRRLGTPGATVPPRTPAPSPTAAPLRSPAPPRAPAPPHTPAPPLAPAPPTGGRR